MIGYEDKARYILQQLRIIGKIFCFYIFNPFAVYEDMKAEEPFRVITPVFNFLAISF